MAVFGHQFVTLTVDICVQHGGREAPSRAGMLAAAETCLYLLPVARSSSNTWFLGPRSQSPNRHLDRFSRFRAHERDKHTDRQTTQLRL